MKYVTPKYEAVIVETKDVIAASVDKYEIEQNENGSGNVIISAFDIFK